MDRSGHRTIQPQDQAKSKLNGPENLALSSYLGHYILFPFNTRCPSGATFPNAGLALRRITPEMSAMVRRSTCAKSSVAPNNMDPASSPPPAWKRAQAI
jgi:hypothetical protein